MDASQHKTAFAALVALLVGGLFAAAIYVAGASTVCKSLLKTQDRLENIGAPHDESKNEIQSGNQYKKYTTDDLRRAVIGTPDDVPSASAAQHDEGYKYGSWTKDFFCESKIGDIIIAFCTYCLVIVTGWLAWATLQLWDTTKQLAEDAERNIKILQRAYLAVEGLGVRPFGPPGEKSIAQIVVRNVGNLPAREVQWFINVRIDDFGASADFPIGPRRSFFGPVVLAKGTSMVRNQEFETTEAQHLAVIHQRTNIYVWGKITYWDGFDTERFTLFCHRYSGGARVWNIQGPLQGRWEVQATDARIHRFGNDAD